MFENVLLRAAAAAAATALVTVGAVGPVHAAGEGKGSEKASTSQGATKSTEKRTGPDHSQGNASTQGDDDKPQPESNADKFGGGANSYDCENGPKGPYCSTRTGEASDNGEGDGAAKGRPAAGTVGKADNKNPNGQEPGPSDRNQGYECDGNNGIAQGNPAHTGCTSTVDADDAGDDAGDNAGDNGDDGDSSGDNGNGHTPVTVCHLLGNGGYIVLTFDENALDAHVGHGDLYPVPANGCPASAPDGGVLPDEVDDVPTTDVPTTDVPTTDVPTTDVPTVDVPVTDGGPTADEVLGVEDERDEGNAGVAEERDEVLGVEGERSANRAPALAPAAGILPSTGATDVLMAVVAGIGLLAAGIVLITRRRPQDSR